MRRWTRATVSLALVVIMSSGCGSTVAPVVAPAPTASPVPTKSPVAPAAPAPGASASTTRPSASPGDASDPATSAAALAGYEAVSPEDRQVLEELVRQGVDLSQPRTIEHFFVAPSRRQAQRTAQALRQAGLECDVEEHEGQHTVVARQQSDLSEPSVLKFEQLVAQVAASTGAEYDGWGTHVR